MDQRHREDILPKRCFLILARMTGTCKWFALVIGNLLCCWKRQQAKCSNLGSHPRERVTKERNAPKILCRLLTDRFIGSFFTENLPLRRTPALRYLKPLNIHSYKKLEMLFSSKIELSFILDCSLGNYSMDVFQVNGKVQVVRYPGLPGVLTWRIWDFSFVATWRTVFFAPQGGTFRSKNKEYRISDIIRWLNLCTRMTANTTNYTREKN